MLCGQKETYQKMNSMSSQDIGKLCYFTIETYKSCFASVIGNSHLDTLPNRQGAVSQLHAYIFIRSNDGVAVYLRTPTAIVRLQNMHAKDEARLCNFLEHFKKDMLHHPFSVLTDVTFLLQVNSIICNYKRCNHKQSLE